MSPKVTPRSVSPERVPRSPEFKKFLENHIQQCFKNRGEICYGLFLLSSVQTRRSFLRRPFFLPISRRSEAPPSLLLLSCDATYSSSASSDSQSPTMSTLLPLPKVAATFRLGLTRFLSGGRFLLVKVSPHFPRFLALGTLESAPIDTLSRVRFDLNPGLTSTLAVSRRPRSSSESSAAASVESEDVAMLCRLDLPIESSRVDDSDRLAGIELMSMSISSAPFRLRKTVFLLDILRSFGRDASNVTTFTSTEQTRYGRDAL